MKRIKRSILAVVIMFAMLLSLPMQHVSAAETDGVLIGDVAFKTASGNYGSLASASFTSTDVRDGSAINFSGSSGKNSVFIFGGLGSCVYTAGAISRFNELTACMDMSKVNIYAFDIKGNSTDAILEVLESYEISDQIKVGELTSSVTSVRRTCASYAGLSGTYYLPFIVYVNSAGVMYDYTTGSTDTETIIEKLRAGGLTVNYTEPAMQTLYVTGKTSYTYAYEILDSINATRAAGGLSAVQMDQELLNVAMQRAAECAVLYSHTRPDGSSCFTASSKMTRENIAAGYQTPSAVMEGWINSSGHYANIMGEDNQSVGVGCFQMNGVWFWVQCFGSTEATVASAPADGNQCFTIKADDSVDSDVEYAGYNVNVGANHEISVVVINDWNASAWSICDIDNESYQWSSNNTNIATVNSAGVVTGVSAGTATITGVNIGKPEKTVTFTAYVREASGGGSGTTGGGSGTTDTSDPEVSSNNVTGKDRFVALLYENVLERNARQSEIASWVQELNNGKTGAEVAYGFLFSQEFTNKNLNDSDYVERLYMSMMGRASDEGGKSDWVTHLSNGVSRLYVFKQFIGSAEFTNLCEEYGIIRGDVALGEARDMNYDVTRFVARNYREFLGRNYDVSGLNDWTSRINNREQTMQEIASGFVFSPECINMNLSNEEYVQMLYRGCFDRPGDEAGVADWVSQLNAGTKNREEVFWGFANSQEFANMVSSYGL